MLAHKNILFQRAAATYLFVTTSGQCYEALYDRNLWL